MLLLAWQHTALGAGQHGDSQQKPLAQMPQGERSMGITEGSTW
jgi:hypothetical protein